MSAPHETPEQVVTRATARARAVREAAQAEARKLAEERAAEAEAAAERRRNGVGT